MGSVLYVVVGNRSSRTNSHFHHRRGTLMWCSVKTENHKQLNYKPIYDAARDTRQDIHKGQVGQESMYEHAMQRRDFSLP